MATSRRFTPGAASPTIEKVCQEAAKLWNVPDIETIPPFYDDAGFIEACAARAA